MQHTINKTQGNRGKYHVYCIHTFWTNSAYKCLPKLCGKDVCFLAVKNLSVNTFCCFPTLVTISSANYSGWWQRRTCVKQLSQSHYMSGWESDRCSLDHQSTILHFFMYHWSYVYCIHTFWTSNCSAVILSISCTLAVQSALPCCKLRSCGANSKHLFIGKVIDWRDVYIMWCELPLFIHLFITPKQP